MERASQVGRIQEAENMDDIQVNDSFDDGLKVNCGKFGDLLAESKAITGGEDEE
jgi:hypothetical protein